MDSARRVSGSLTVDSTAEAAAFLGRPPEAGSGVGMLPTPAKTPQKPPTVQSKAKIKSVARNLFPSEDEAMPAPMKTRGQQRLLDSFSATQSDASFQIFTDTNARVPVADTSVANPFYGPGAAAASSAQPSKRKGKGKRATVTVPGKGKVAIDELVGRDDGMVITFRGKKQYLKFADEEDDDSGAEDDSAAAVGTVSISRRVTRSSIKPRLLFPPKASGEAEDEDEEAATDIEDLIRVANENLAPDTPVELIDSTPNTPATPRFAPASPPTTARVTRQGSKTGAEASPIKAKTGGEKKNSPLGWRVSKGGYSAKHGVKRPANTEGGSGSPVKRAKA